MTKYPLNLAPGATVVIETRGSFLYFESASAGGADTSVKVVIPGNGGGEVILQVGQGFKVDADYDRLFVSNNLGAGTIVGQLVIADGTFFDNRVVGTVSVIDGGKSRTYSGQSYMMFGSGPVVAGQNTLVQLWNPAASGKNIILEAMTYSSGGNGGVVMKMHNAALATLYGAGQSKKSGGGVSSGLVNVVSVVGALGGATILGLNLNGGMPITYKPAEPIILTPGWGLVMTQTALATDLSSSFEWYEEAVGS